MRKILYTTTLFICTLITSCSDNDNQVSPINGTWRTFERTVNLKSETKSADAEYLQERINIYYAKDSEIYDIKKTYTEESLTTITTLKSDGTPIGETVSTYSIDKDSITINDRIYGTMRYEFVITDKILTTYGNLNKKRIADIIEQLGIVFTLPEDITGTIKIKDYR